MDYPILDITLEATGALEAQTFCAMTDAGLVETPGADDVDTCGVVISCTDAAPYVAQVRVLGMAWVKSAGQGAIAGGDLVGTHSDGKAKPANPANGTTSRPLPGRAYSACDNTEDELVSVLILSAAYVGA